MRWIFVSLILLNLAYLGYEFSQPKEVVADSNVEVDIASAAAPIKLLTEVSQPQKKQTKSKVNQRQPLCWVVGPYQVELDAKHTYARMMAIDIPAKVEKKAIVVKEEYWVYLAPLPNKKQAIRKLKELQKRKIDSFIITEGELANGISLGLFSKKESVDRLLKTLKKKRIEPQVKPLQRTRNQFWVTSPVNKQFTMDENTRKRVTEGRKVEWNQIHCETGLPSL